MKHSSMRFSLPPRTRFLCSCLVSFFIFSGCNLLFLLQGQCKDPRQVEESLHGRTFEREVLWCCCRQRVCNNLMLPQGQGHIAICLCTHCACWSVLRGGVCVAGWGGRIVGDRGSASLSSKQKSTQSVQNRNHLKEKLLDQAQARAAYTPLFWGHSRSIPQGMILDIQPLVKSLFCPIRPSPNGFFDSEASTP